MINVNIARWNGERWKIVRKIVDNNNPVFYNRSNLGNMLGGDVVPIAFESVIDSPEGITVRAKNGLTLDFEATDLSFVGSITDKPLFVRKSVVIPFKTEIKKNGDLGLRFSFKK
ncbi:MAG: hypothetical protein WC069_01605 [Candidatus Shapirobacteria bacterium]